MLKQKNQTVSFENCLILSGQRWIRTTEGVSQQIYSLPHLATLVFAHSKKFCLKKSDSLENYQILLRAEDGAQTRDPQLGRPYALNSYGIEITN